MGVLLDWHAVVHFVDAQDLRLAAVASKLVIFAHDERLDRLRWTDFGAEPTEAAAREIEVEVIENLDLLSRFAMSAEGNQVVGTRLGALVADDARLGACAGLGLQPQHAPEAGRGRTALRRVLKREGWLRRVLQRDPQPFEQIHEENRLEKAGDGLHVVQSCQGSGPLANDDRFRLSDRNDPLSAQDR